MAGSTLRICYYDIISTTSLQALCYVTMRTNPYQGQNPDQSNQYGGYSGYTPPAQQGASYGQQGYQQGDDQYVYGQQGQQQQQQMYNTYQPPQSATARGQGSAEATEPTSLKMNARNEAVLSYLFWGIS